jgi:hypothetical protein
MRERVLGRVLRIAAERAGAPTGLRFTERQLYYELCRVALPAQRLPSRPAFTLAAPVSYRAFQEALSHHGDIPGLLRLAPPDIGPPGRHTPEPDLFDYGLPRLLVCESEAIAQMLRANGLAMESSCPVVGAAELPLDDRIANMLARAEQPTIYVVHDASAQGLAFPTRLRDLTDIPPGVRVVPLGMRPQHAARLHVFHRRGAPLSVEAPVTPWERAWLGRGRFADLEAVRPASLLRTVHRLVREIHPPPTFVTELRRVRATGFLTWPAA